MAGSSTAANGAKASPAIMSDTPRYRRYRPEERAAMLVEAGLAVLAEGGIAGFTVDNICKKSGASRGLIAHHFGAKEGLLAACYAAAYAPLLADLAPEEGMLPDLATLLDRLFSAEHFRPETLRLWLALWGEVAGNPALQAEHRRLYTAFRASLARAIAALAPQAKAETLAVSIIALADGLWLELCIAPDLMPAARARALCADLLEPVLGPLPSGTAEKAVAG